MAKVDAKAPAPPDQGYDPVEVMEDNIEWLKLTTARQARAVQYLALAIVAVCLVTILSWVMRPKPVFFASTPDLRFVKLTPLSEPVLTETGVKDWALNTFSDAMSLHFTTWRKQLQDVKPLFTTEAYRAFEANLQSSGIMDDIKSQRLDILVSPTGPVVITNEQPKNGVLYVDLQFPITLAYMGGTGGETSPQNLLVKLTLRRVPVSEQPTGMAIAKLSMVPASIADSAGGQ